MDIGCFGVVLCMLNLSWIKVKNRKKINDYYEVYFVGDNRNAIIGQELVLTFIPANETGPDNNKTQENRILYGKSYLRPYRVDWWKLYQHKFTFRSRF